MSENWIPICWWMTGTDCCQTDMYRAEGKASHYERNKIAQNEGNICLLGKQALLMCPKKETLPLSWTGFPRGALSTVIKDGLYDFWEGKFQCWCPSKNQAVRWNVLGLGSCPSPSQEIRKRLDVIGGQNDGYRRFRTKPVWANREQWRSCTVLMNCPKTWDRHGKGGRHSSDDPTREGEHFPESIGLEHLWSNSCCISCSFGRWTDPSWESPTEWKCCLLLNHAISMHDWQQNVHWRHLLAHFVSLEGKLPAMWFDSCGAGLTWVIRHGWGLISWKSGLRR